MRYVLFFLGCYFLGVLTRRLIEGVYNGDIGKFVLGSIFSLLWVLILSLFFIINQLLTK